MNAATYEVVAEDTKVEVEVTVASKVTITFVYTADTDLKDVTVNGAKLEGATVTVNPGTEIVVTAKKGTAAKGDVLVAEPTTGSKGEIWGCAIEGDTYTLTLPAATKAVSYTLATATGELAAKAKFNGTSANGVTFVVLNSDLSAEEPVAYVKTSDTPTTRLTFERLISGLYAGAGQDLTFVEAYAKDGTKFAAESYVPTDANLAGVDRIICSVDGKVITIWVQQSTDEAKTPVNIYYNGKIVAKTLPNGADEVTISGLKAGSRFYVTDGNDKYTITSSSDSTLAKKTADADVYVNKVSEDGTVTFKVIAGLAGKDLTICDSFYKLTSVDASGSAAAAAYVEAGSEIKVENYRTGAGSHFKMTTGADATLVYYDENGAAQKGAYFIGLTGKDFVAVMPAADDVTVTAKFWEVTAEGDTDLSTVLPNTAVIVGGVAYVADQTEISSSADTNVLVTKADGSQELSNGTKKKITSDCSLKSGKFIEITVDNDTKYLEGETIDLTTLAEVLGLNADEFVKITAKVGKNGTKEAKKLNTNGDDLEKFDGASADKNNPERAYIPVSALANLMTTDVEELEITTGFCMVTIDATGFSANGAGSLTGVTVDAKGNTDYSNVGIDPDEKTVVFVKAGKAIVVTVADSAHIVWNGVDTPNYTGEAIKLSEVIWGNSEFIVTNPTPPEADTEA